MRFIKPHDSSPSMGWKMKDQPPEADPSPTTKTQWDMGPRFSTFQAPTRARSVMLRFSFPLLQSLLSPRSKRVMLIGLLLFTCSSAEPVLVTLPMVTHSVHPRRAVGVDCSCFISPSPPRLARVWSSPREPQPSRNQPPSGSLYGCVGTGTQASRSHNNNK